MRRARRFALVAIAVVLVGIVALALRTLDAIGLLTEIRPVACRNPSVIAGIAGPEDMQFDAQSGLVFISGTNRRAGSARQDGIYVWRPGQKDPPRRLAGTPATFHPLGISLFRDGDGSLSLMAINFPATGNPNVDIFDVTGAARGNPALRERESITSGLLVDPFAVVAVDKDRFYATNAHTTHSRFDRLLDNYLLLPRADVVYFDGSAFRTVANHLLYASGIERSADGTTIYVAERLGREINAYTRNPFSGDLTFATSLPIASGLDNIDAGSDRSLIVAGHPKLLALLGYATDSPKPSPSEIFEVALDAHSRPIRASLLYSNLEVSAASVGVRAGGRLLVGSALDRRILSCAVP